MIATSDLLSLQEVSEILHLSDKTVRKLCATGELPATKLASRWYVRARDLEALLDPFSSAPTHGDVEHSSVVAGWAASHHGLPAGSRGPLRDPRREI